MKIKQQSSRSIETSLWSQMKVCMRVWVWWRIVFGPEIFTGMSKNCASQWIKSNSPRTFLLFCLYLPILSLSIQLLHSTYMYVFAHGDMLRFFFCLSMHLRGFHWWLFIHSTALNHDFRWMAPIEYAMTKHVLKRFIGEIKSKILSPKKNHEIFKHPYPLIDRYFGLPCVRFRKFYRRCCMQAVYQFIRFYFF